MAARAGVDPIDRVLVFDNHDAAYHAWHDGGVKGRTLIHIDAHHDMWRPVRPGAITIANFVSAAWSERLVDHVIWVIPDRSWESAHTRRIIQEHVRLIARGHSEIPRSPRIEDRQIVANVGGQSLTVCPLAFLPVMSETVLLDIDVDFCIIPRVSFGRSDEHARIPWCWPDELVASIRTAEVKTDFVTIARSVEGGYTPLKWKYLADEVEERLKNPGLNSPAIAVMNLIRDAAWSVERGDLAAAKAQLLRARDVAPMSAAPLYHLANLEARFGRIDNARTFYQDVLRLDSTYRTPFNSAGFNLYWDGRLEEAEAEHRRVLELDPADAYAYVGLGMIACRRKRWNEATNLFRTTLALNGNLVDAHRGLGETLAHLNHGDEAIAAYERSLKLALGGHKPVQRTIVTGNRDRVLDDDHCRVHAELARLYASRGRTARAIAGYQISIAGGHDGVSPRTRLAGLYVKEANWASAGHEIHLLTIALPRLLRIATGRFTRRLRRMVDVLAEIPWLRAPAGKPPA